MRATRTDEAETETDDGVRRTDPRAREGRREREGADFQIFAETYEDIAVLNTL
jgi:hypothetical protein